MKAYNILTSVRCCQKSHFYAFEELITSVWIPNDFITTHSIIWHCSHMLSLALSSSGTTEQKCPTVPSDQSSTEWLQWFWFLNKAFFADCSFLSGVFIICRIMELLACCDPLEQIFSIQLQKSIFCKRRDWLYLQRSITPESPFSDPTVPWSC